MPRKQLSVAGVCTTCLYLLICLTAWGQPPDRGARGGVAARDWPRNLPILFEQNRGQVFSDVKYLVRGKNNTLLLTSTSLGWAFYPPPEANVPIQSLRKVSESESIHVVWLDLLGISPLSKPEGEQESSSQISYIRGPEPTKWLRGIPNYRRVRYSGVYPGIDLVFYGDDDRLEYDFVVSPNADPTQIRWKVRGAGSLEVDSEGNLVMSTPFGTVQHLTPRIYQHVDGLKKEIRGGYRLLKDGVFSFAVDPSYDRGSTLTIDPVLVYSTYLGGTRGEVPGGIQVDAQGNVYLAGNTGSLDFPLHDPYQDAFAGGGTPNGDVFVTKIDASGSFIVYSTYVGGGGTDLGRGIVVDSQGRAIVTGTTFSGDFPSTPGSFQPVCSGQCPFVFRLSADGSELSYATFVGRGDGTGISIDSSDQVAITGRTSSSDFPVKDAFQPTRGGGSDAFVAKLNASGTGLAFSTYLGGSEEENLIGKQDVAHDPDGNIYVTGRTNSEDFPLQNALQGSHGGENDAFVTKLNPQGVLIYSTYLGGALDDEGQGIAADGSGSAYVAGNTLSLDFPSQNAFQPAYGGGVAIGDAFLAKIVPDGGSLSFSTYLGGELGDTANDIALDELSRPVIVGNGASNFPVQHPIRSFNGIDNYVAKFTEDGSGLFYATPIGGGDQDVVVTTFGTNVMVAGNISSGDYPVLNAMQPRSAGDTEVFLSHLSDMGTLYFAQFGNGVAGEASAVSDILLTGSSTAATSRATLTFRGDDGDLLPVNVLVTDNEGNSVPHDQVSELEVEVPPLGLVKISTDGAGDLVAGSVTVDFDGPIGGLIRFTLNPFGTAGVGDSELVGGFVSPVRRTAINTGVAIFNPENRQIGLTMRLHDPAGEEIPGGLRSTAMQAHEHLVGFIDELFPNAELTNFEGTITVEATTPDALIAATVLELGGVPGQFTTLPVTPVP